MSTSAQDPTTLQHDLLNFRVTITSFSSSPLQIHRLTFMKEALDLVDELVDPDTTSWSKVAVVQREIEVRQALTQLQDIADAHRLRICIHGSGKKGGEVQRIANLELDKLFETYFHLSKPPTSVNPFARPPPITRTAVSPPAIVQRLRSKAALQVEEKKNQNPEKLVLMIRLPAMTVKPSFTASPSENRRERFQHVFENLPPLLQQQCDQEAMILGGEATWEDWDEIPAPYSTPCQNCSAASIPCQQTTMTNSSPGPCRYCDIMQQECGHLRAVSTPLFVPEAQSPTTAEGVALTPLSDDNADDCILTIRSPTSPIVPVAKSKAYYPRAWSQRPKQPTMKRKLADISRIEAEAKKLKKRKAY